MSVRFFRTDSLALARQGDILSFDSASLKFTYRYGQWQYWNHDFLITLLQQKARSQRVPQKSLKKIVYSIYRVALDVSFRRSGGLFVLLHAKRNLSQIVRSGDAIGDPGRSPADAEFDNFVTGKHIQSLSRTILVELASLDGAVVLANNGTILAYGAVLSEVEGAPLDGSEGSRTKAAISASMFGIAIKVSADGDITAYLNGEPFLKV